MVLSLCNCIYPPTLYLPLLPPPSIYPPPPPPSAFYLPPPTPSLYLPPPAPSLYPLFTPLTPSLYLLTPRQVCTPTVHTWSLPPDSMDLKGNCSDIRNYKGYSENGVKVNDDVQVSSSQLLDPIPSKYC